MQVFLLLVKFLNQQTKLKKVFSLSGNIKKIMRNKNFIYVLIIIIGIIISSIGVFFKITHWSFFGISGSQLLVFGTILETIGILMFLSKMFFPKKTNEI